jgi:predicted ATP-binding protein involved in virulence
MNIQEIHNKVFDFLRNQYPDLRFVLRTTNKYGRLHKGYWFMGGENYVCISFWDIRDSSYMTPKIFFQIGNEEETQIIFTDKDSLKLKTNDKTRSTFFENISSTLNMKVKAGKQNLVWESELSLRADNNRRMEMDTSTSIKEGYLYALKNFIDVGKKNIDTFIKVGNVKSYFPDVEENDFNRKVNRVLELKKELYNQTATHITKEIEKDYIVLNRLELNNIGHFEQLELDLSKRIICLIGENGSGKSTILQSLVLGLTTLRDSDYIKENNDRLQNLIQINAAERAVVDYSPKGKIVLGYNDKYNNCITFTKVESGVDDNGEQYADYVDIDDSESDFKNFKETKNPADNYFKSLIKSFSQVKSVLNGQKNVISSVKEPNFSDVTPLLYNHPDKSFENIRTWILKSIDIETPATERLKMREVVVKIFEIISEITRFKVSLAEFELGQAEVFIKTDDAPNGIPIRLMSQGYNNVIGWVGDFMKRLWEVTPENEDFTQTHAICIIDEIDTYLHPKWQRTILNVLANKFINTQFIVTTHSPLVITHLDNKEAQVYHISPQKITPIVAKGREIANATLDLFGVLPRPMIYQELIDKLYRDFENEDIKMNSLEEQLGHLKELLTDADPDVANGIKILEGLKFAEQYDSN